jgi:uncharacterized protein YecT (DUF1311 family)
MPRHLLASLLIAATFAAAPAAAQEQSPYEQCLAKAKGDAGMLVCAKAELTRQEVRLKAVEAKLGGMQPPKAKPLYQAANDAWRKFRDAQCAWDRAGVAAGPAADYAETDCKVGITESRVAELEARAAPPDEDEPQKKK